MRGLFYKGTQSLFCPQNIFAKKQAEQYLDGIVQSVESTADKPIPTKRKHAEDEIKTLRAQNAALQKWIGDIQNIPMKFILEKLIKSIMSYEKKAVGFDPTAFYIIAMSPKILYEKNEHL